MSEKSNPKSSAAPQLYGELSALGLQEQQARLATLRGQGQHALAAELERLLLANRRPSLHWSALLKPLDSESAIPSLPAGTRVGRFVVDGELGRGGMGVVYAGHRADGTIEQKVAIKLSQLNSGSSATMDGLAKEAALLSTLRHPGIAQFVDIVSLEHGCLAMVMEQIQGTSLEKWLEGRVLELRQILNLLVAAGESLRHAHGHRVLHGDVKPSNIMLDAHEQPRLLDFGIAVLMAEPGSQQAFGASPGYAAPEVLEQGLIDMRSDVYSLGMLGRVLLAQVRDGSAGRYSAVADLRAVLDHATQDVPERRYPDMGSLLADLQAISDRRPISLPLGRHAYDAVRFVQRRPAIVSLSAAAILALLVAVVGISLALARAERQRIAAEHAQNAAAQRASELEQVTQFQSEQLSKIDAAAMGLGLRESIVKARVDAVEAAHGDVEKARNEATRALLGVNFTDIALTSLDGYVFARAVTAIDQTLANKPLLQARLLRVVGQTYGELGMYAQARPLGERVLKIYRSERGEEHPDTVTAAVALGTLLTGTGDVEAGGRLIRQAYEFRERTLPNSDKDRLMTAFSMGDQLIAESKHREASALLESTLAMQIRMLGESAPETLKTMTSLFTAHYELGELEPAEALATRRVDIVRRSYGPTDPLTLRAMTDHQNILGDMGRLEEAIALGEEVLAAKRRALGDMHHETILSINNLGMTYANAMRFDSAEPLMREALQRITELFGANHPHALSAASNLGMIYLGQGKEAEAEASARIVLVDARATLGDEHPFTLARINDLGVMLMRKGDLKGAEALYREALSAARRIDGDRHPMTLGKIANLGDLMRQMGRLEEADVLGAESVNTARIVFPADHPDLARYLARHARTLVAQHRYAEAETQMLAAHPVMLAAYGADNRLTRQVVEDLAKLYEVRQKQEPNSRYAAESARWRALLPPPTPATTH